MMLRLQRLLPTLALRNTKTTTAERLLLIRTKATTTAAATTSSSCPFSGASSTTTNTSHGRAASTAATLHETSFNSEPATTMTRSHGSSNETVPKLSHVPKLPIVGSAIREYSKIPDLLKLEFWPQMRQQFGDFYTFGLPGIGADIYGTCYVIQDPHVMAQLIRHEGQYPSGTTETNFCLHKYFRERNRLAQHFFAQAGPEWKRLRQFVQADMMSPASSERYLPAICQAARMAAMGAPSYRQDMNKFLIHASCDMFSNVLIGSSPDIADPTVETKPEDKAFCQHISTALKANSELQLSLWDALLIKMFNIRTKKYKVFEDNWGAADIYAQEKVKELIRKPQSEQTDLERNCYTMAAFERTQNESNRENQLTKEQIECIVPLFLAMGVDSTANNASWKVLHLAFSPEAQERVYQEQLQLHGGPPETLQVTPDSVLPRNAPFLHACIRESHRLANPAIPIPNKRFTKPVTIFGVELPPRTTVILDGYSTGVDPRHWEDEEDTMAFKPQRFLKDAVQARKDTPAAVVDHTFFSGPFSQGARRCPGSRVANLELATMLANLVVHWEFSVAPDPETGKMPYTHWSQVPYGLETINTSYLPAMDFVPRRHGNSAEV